MDVDSIPPLKCNKIRVETFTPLHISISEDEDLTCLVLWNEFMILLYDSDQLSASPSVYYHDKFITNVQCTRNILLFIDCQNVMYFTILRKQEGVRNTVVSQIVLKKLFGGILSFNITFNEIVMLCKIDTDYFVNVFNIIGSSKFKLDKKFQLNDVEAFQFSDSQIYIKKLNCFSMDFIKHVLLVDADIPELDGQILFIRRKDTVYAHILNNSEKGLSAIHVCPANIVHLSFDDEICSKLYIFLVTGSLVILSSESSSKQINLFTLHLNCSIHQVGLENQHILYTNTNKFWESKIILENELSVKHRLLKITNVNDFSITPFSKIVYCVTLDNLIYSFHIKSEEHFSSKQNVLNEEYIPIPKSLKATGKIFKTILKEMNRNKHVLEMITCENNLITSMALSKIPELSVQNLNSKVKIYHNMKDIDYVESHIILIEDLHNYYLNGTQIYLIEFSMSSDFREKLEEFLKDKTQTWYLNINLENNLKKNVVSVKLSHSLDLKIAIPIYGNVTIPTNLLIKLVSLIPDLMSPESYCWCFFPCNEVVIDTKYHLQLKDKPTNISQESENDKIIKIAQQFSSKISKIKKEKILMKPTFNIPYYIRVPDQYDAYATDFITHFVQCLNPKCAQIIKKHLDPENITSTFYLNITEKVIEIKLTSENNIKKIEVYGKDNNASWQIYKYFFDCLTQFAESESPKTIANFDFMRLQRMKNDTNFFLISSTNIDTTTISTLAREFYNDIIGILPL